MAGTRAPGGARAGTRRPPRGLDVTARALDERFGTAGFARKAMRKAFPDQWTFLLGEIAMYSFVIILLTGVYLTLFFKPSMHEVVYNGSYTRLKGVEMSEAYASSLKISFDVRGGLLVRQIHHWSTLIFMGAILVHMLRNFFTGAFRKPRELNWLIGVAMFMLVMLNGLFGYSLPDDLLSGTGLRILEGVLASIPLVGSYAVMFLFGGEYPGTDIIPRLYVIHVLLIPGILAALIPLHAVVLTWRQTHTQFPGKGSSNTTVRGYPFFPVFIAKTTAFFLWVLGVTTLLAAFFQINPIWLFGPYDPGAISSGSQPDWYMGWLEGALRIMPSWEISVWGHTVAMSVVVPALVVPGLLFTGLAAYPFLERWVTGDSQIHHLLDRPRDVPARTGIGVGGVVFYGGCGSRAATTSSPTASTSRSSGRRGSSASSSSSDRCWPTSSPTGSASACNTATSAWPGTGWRPASSASRRTGGSARSSARSGTRRSPRSPIRVPRPPPTWTSRRPSTTSTAPAAAPPGDACARPSTAASGRTWPPSPNAAKRNRTASGRDRGEGRVTLTRDARTGGG
ncbi:cytochrome b N-terminal domain-containing protein [Actinomadura luteofluorescens]|uniref:cytochrome bc1 complex cytochrome b subunit n=1 Tax=Actinomadura luteofluorescens TaxID=46163 RepID=UPI00363EF83A